MGTKNAHCRPQAAASEAAQEFRVFTEQPKRNFWTLLLLVTRPGYTTPHRKQRSNRSSGNTLRRQEQRSSNKSCLPGKSWLAFFGIERAYCCASFMPKIRTTINADRVRFHHDNARPHTANRTTALVERFGWEMMSHPPYSPDLAPSDFHLFPELKKNLGGTQFQTDEEVQNAVVNFHTDRRQSSITLV
ncbi:uncharacterized protein TNCV_2465121 [Trichonephila clavipes]|uniref:Histone-lysine N-methyltransferase SETMAR n=1 Tax=Trichonephila clavipes TaxID=2585209 RepID=A0A8X6R7M7_TRICX|nr:uncharacterized protein TNCV_2465121 [Trichonephila clavipes]